jgi:hypothetical protein
MTTAPYGRVLDGGTEALRGRTTERRAPGPGSTRGLWSGDPSGLNLPRTPQPATGRVAKFRRFRPVI